MIWVIVFGGIGVLIILINNLIKDGVAAVNKDIDEDKGNVKGCVQILGYAFIGWAVYFILSNM